MVRKANVLAEQSALRKSMAARAFERAQRFSVENMVEAYVGIYRETLRAGSQPSALRALPSTV